MVSGLRWRRVPPARATERWTFIQRSNGIPDAIVVIDGTDDGRKVVIANEAARQYLDKQDDGTALTYVTSQYTRARTAPVTLTLARREWRLTELETQAQVAFNSVLRNEPVDVTCLRDQASQLRQQLDALNNALAV